MASNKRKFLDELYDQRALLAAGIKTAEKAGQCFPDDGYSDKVHTAETKMLRAHYAAVNRLIDAFVDNFLG